MHGFSKDGAHLVVHDGLALTKIDFPKTVKSDEELGGLWLSLAGNRLVVNVARTGRCIHRTVDALLNLKWTPGNYGQFALLHDDKRALEFGDGSLRLVSTEGPTQSELAWPEKMPKRAKVELGPTAPNGSGSTFNACAVSEDHLVAHYIGAREALLIGKIERGKKLAPIAALTVGNLAIPPILAIDGETVFIAALDRANKRAKLCAVTDGTLSDVHVIETISAPTFSGTRWCWQPDEATVLTAKWGALDKRARYEIPAEAQGAGEIFAHGDERLLFMPTYGERVYDLRSKAVFDRKLSSKRKKAREIARKTVARTDQWLAEENGRVTLTQLTINRQDKRVTWAPVFNMGSATLSALCAFGQVTYESLLPGERALSVSSHSGNDALVPSALDDVRRAFSALDRYDGDLRMGLLAVETCAQTFFEQARKKKDGSWPRLFDDDAARALLVALFECDKSDERLGVRAEDADRFAQRKVTAKWLAEQRFNDKPNSWALVASLAGFLALELLGEDALPVLRRWYIEEPSEEVNGSPFGTVASVRCLVKRFPATKRAVKEACKAAGEHGAAVLEELRG
ncbi:MAG: hypothetical protein U0269_28125 [Polyangiales bacterium]